MDIVKTPWGEWIDLIAPISTTNNLTQTPMQYRVKRIQVNPGQQFSYQTHKHRMEQWLFVEGVGIAIINDEIHPLAPKRIIEIEVGDKHRVRNTGNTPLIFIELQWGSYIGEDDIERFEDDYNRI